MYVQPVGHGVRSLVVMRGSRLVWVLQLEKWLQEAFHVLGEMLSAWGSQLLELWPWVGAASAGVQGQVECWLRVEVHWGPGLIPGQELSSEGPHARFLRLNCSLELGDAWS